MKKLLSILAILCLFSSVMFADEEGDEYDDGYTYEQNGAGDQFIKIDVMANFPINFDSQVKIGLAASLGYYRFLTKQIAVGGDVIVGYNVTVGKKALFTAPITFGVMYQPYIGKFEFPIFANIGIANSSCQGMTNFPSFSAKLTAGAYYRMFESWSFGLVSSLYWIPQFVKEDTSKNDNGIFVTAGITARYHF